MTAYFVKNAINEKCKVGWALWLGKGWRLGKGRAGQRGGADEEGDSPALAGANARGALVGDMN